VGRKHSRRQAVSHPDPATTLPARGRLPVWASPATGAGPVSGCSGPVPHPSDRPFDSRRHFQSEGTVSSEITRRPKASQGNLSRLEHLDPGGESLYRGHHRLPTTSLGAGVASQDLQVGPARLGLPPALANSCPLGSGRR